MNFKALLSVFALFISTISALSVINFPLNLRVEPGSDLSLQLEGNDIAPGDHVRVELWDNQDDEDVNAAILGEELTVGDNLTINIDIPSHFPKTKNAFLRIYYKCHNTVTPRFIIKPAKNCLDNKKPHKPAEISTIDPTPLIIYQPTATHAPTPAPTHVVIAGPAGPAGGSDAAGHVAVVTGVTSAARPSSIKSSATVMSSTSTSSASVAKFSAGSIVLALTVAFAMLF